MSTFHLLVIVGSQHPVISVQSPGPTISNRLGNVQTKRYINGLKMQTELCTHFTFSSPKCTGGK